MIYHTSIKKPKNKRKLFKVFSLMMIHKKWKKIRNRNLMTLKRNNWMKIIHYHQKWIQSINKIKMTIQFNEIWILKISNNWKRIITWSKKKRLKKLMKYLIQWMRTIKQISYKGLIKTLKWMNKNKILKQRTPTKLNNQSYFKWQYKLKLWMNINQKNE